MALTQTNLGDSLPLLARGKVRDVYILSEKELLFVATDRISAYDVIMENGIPSKGKLLTTISAHWFSLLGDICPNHLISTSIPSQLSPYKTQLEGRSMVVKRLKVYPIEAIVRGYITGSAWTEYQNSGTVHGIKVRAGMKESERFDKPLFTPSTKAEQGQHDENISPERAAEIIGAKAVKQVEKLAVALYEKAAHYAAERGIIIADTKFEFAHDPVTDDLVLVDEIFTPDSSRFWLASTYEAGKSQDSYDKQYLRDWLTQEGLKGKQGVLMPDGILEGTRKKYIEAYEMITGKKWEEA